MRWPTGPRSCSRLPQAVANSRTRAGSDSVSLEEAAYGYLEASGLWHLVKSTLSLDPEPKKDTQGVVTTKGPEGKGDPFATLDDLVRSVERIFAGPSSIDTPAPVVVVGDATAQQKSGGGGLGIIIAVLAIGAGAVYWFYLRKKGGANG